MLCERYSIANFDLVKPMRRNPYVKPLVENLDFYKFEIWEILKNFHNELLVCKTLLQFSHTASVKSETCVDYVLLHQPFFFLQETFNGSKNDNKQFSLSL